MVPTACASPVEVRGLRHGDRIHVEPHQVFRRSGNAHTVTCREADVTVDCLILVGAVIVICWGHCPGTCGAVVYDADDTVQRLGADVAYATAQRPVRQAGGRAA
jgi:hypothetical protein